MGKRWDCEVPGVPVWAECLRVLKPGGNLLAFAGTRTQHRMCCNIEDAGFEIRDMLAWVYGSGFPKSLDVSKAIDKAAGESVSAEASPITEAANQWQGWGTALKPAFEPITLARKPFTGTVAANVLEWGTGAVNVDGCRVPHGGEKIGGSHVSTKAEGWDRPWKHDAEHIEKRKAEWAEADRKATELGRWPANFLHDGSDEATDLLGDAARFFYCAKASKKDRDDGLEGEEREAAAMQGNLVAGQPLSGDGKPIATPCRKNHHPTVKPTDLMRYLCRLITPPSGLILDPFAGSGSTGKAAMLEGFSFVGIEMQEEYAAIARARAKAA